MKIMYGIPSEGMGHATRSKVILAHLIQSGHDVRVATSDRAYDFIAAAWPDIVFRIKGFHLQFDQGTVSRFSSFAHFLKTAPESLKTNVKQFLRLHRDFTPDVVISDFESFTFSFAKLHHIPLLSIDNMQVINRCHLDLDIPAEERGNYHLAKQIIKVKVPFCSRYLITSFFDAAPRKKETEIIPPILRQPILDANTRSDDAILVYQTATSQDTLVSMLQSVRNCRFQVYGFPRDEDHGSVVLKQFSEQGFIDDLAACRAVLTNGGFSLISEAVYLKKPILSFPLKGQFEQWVNGTQVERMGYGRCFPGISLDAIKAFLYDIDLFQASVDHYTQDGNRRTLEAVDRFLEEVEAGRVSGRMDEDTAD